MHKLMVVFILQQVNVQALSVMQLGIPSIRVKILVHWVTVVQ